LRDQKPPEAVLDSSSALWWIEGLPFGVVCGDAQDGQKRRQRSSKRLIQRHDPGGELLTNYMHVVTRQDPAICLEQVSDGQIWSRRAVRHCTGLQHEPILAARLGHFPYQARLASTGLANQG